MDQVTKIIKRKYNRTALFYDWMDFMISVMERFSESFTIFYSMSACPLVPPFRTEIFYKPQK